MGTLLRILRHSTLNELVLPKYRRRYGSDEDDDETGYRKPRAMVDPSLAMAPPGPSFQPVMDREPNPYLGGKNPHAGRHQHGGGGQQGQAGTGEVHSMSGSTFDQKAPGIIRNLMRDFNLTDYQAAAIVGNFGAETGGFKYHQEISPQGGGRGGIGWAQWTGPRRVAFEKYAQDNKLDVTSDEANYGFLKNELQTNHRHAITNLRGTKDATQATQQFESDYERAGVKNYTSRVNYANQALTAYSKAPSPNTQTAQTSQTARDAQTGNPQGGSGANLVYSNQGATRRYQVTTHLEDKLKDAAEQVYGPGSKVVVYSGGQDHTHRVGSTRHNIDKEGRGQAADVRFYHPDGKQVTGDDLGRVGQYWGAKGYGGIGMTMAGGGVHLDQHTDRAKTWSYGGETTPGQLAQVQSGLKGQMPRLYKSDQPSQTTQMAQNQPKPPPQTSPTGQQQQAQATMATNAATQAATQPTGAAPPLQTANVQPIKTPPTQPMATAKPPITQPPPTQVSALPKTPPPPTTTPPPPTNTAQAAAPATTNVASAIVPPPEKLLPSEKLPSEKLAASTWVSVPYGKRYLPERQVRAAISLLR